MSMLTVLQYTCVWNLSHHVRASFASRPQEALQSGALVTVVDQLLAFYQRATQPSREEGAIQPCQPGQQECGALHAIYSSQLLGRFKIALKGLLESVLHAMLFYYGESGREHVTMYTQDVTMRRYGDPSRNSWVEAPKTKAQTSHAVTAMCGLMNLLVQWESSSGEDPAKGVWEELAKTDAFIGMLLKVYLLCVSSKMETETAQGPSVLDHLRTMVQQVTASRLVQPIIAVLQWCGQDQVGLLPHILELMEYISSREGGEAFMELLLQRRALEAAVEGFLGSCASHLPSEPSQLQLPYIWHLFKVNGSDELRNLSEFGK